MLELLQSVIIAALVVMVIWHHTTLKEMEGARETRCDRCKKLGKCPAAFSWNIRFPCGEYEEDDFNETGK